MHENPIRLSIETCLSKHNFKPIYKEDADFHQRQESDLTHPDNAIKIQSIHKQFNALFSLALIFKSRHVVSPYKLPDTEN